MRSGFGVGNEIGDVRSGVGVENETGDVRSGIDVGKGDWDLSGVGLVWGWGIGKCEEWDWCGKGD